MIKTPDNSAVVIVGAGPSGLMMAAQLLHLGIQPVIIDSKQQLTQESRALAIQSRSMEIFRDLGIDSAFLQAGNKVSAFNFYADTGDAVQFDFATEAQRQTLFPYVLVLEQNKTEKILLEYLTAHACPVYWNCRLRDVQQSEKEVVLQIEQDGEERSLTCDWLIGADGASSRVRKASEIGFPGGTYLNRFYLADLRLESGITPAAVNVFLKKEGFVGIFPINDQLVRCIGIIPPSLQERPELSFEDIKPHITFTLGVPLQIDSCSWFSTYHLHHRMANRFRSRRVFLIGDAAHVHSPLGGQGMNTGLQDAYNLAWKLSGVINKEFDPEILDTYPMERMPVASRLLKTTDRLFTALISRNSIVKFFRDRFAPVIFQQAAQYSGIRSWLFEQISETAIQYRHSALSVHHSSGTKIKAGERLPFLRVYDEKIKEYSDLQQWCSKPGFTLLVIGEVTPMYLSVLAKWIKTTYPFHLNFYYLPPSARNQHIFDAFEIKEGKRKAIIVRPDSYIGYIQDIVDFELIDVYLKEVIGWRVS